MEASYADEYDYHVWELIGLPQGKRLIDSEWLYNIEHNAHGDVK